MSVELSDAYTFIGFAGTLTMAVAAAIIAGWRTAKWLLGQFKAVIATSQQDLIDKIDKVDEKVEGTRTEMKDLSTSVKAIDTVQNQHGERLAWLEGQSGQPLGSVTRERTPP